MQRESWRGIFFACLQYDSHEPEKLKAREDLWIGMCQDKSTRIKGCVHWVILLISWYQGSKLSWSASEVSVNIPDPKWRTSLVLRRFQSGEYRFAKWVCVTIPHPWCTVPAAANHCQWCLSQPVLGEPTTITETKSSTLDLFLTNCTLVKQVRVIPGISDHEAVFIKSSLRALKNTPSPRRIYKYIYLWADYDGVRNGFRKFAQNISVEPPELGIQTL